jgi:hypothetical protein
MRARAHEQGVSVAIGGGGERFGLGGVHGRRAAEARPRP